MMRKLSMFVAMVSDEPVPQSPDHPIAIYFPAEPISPSPTRASFALSRARPDRPPAERSYSIRPRHAPSGQRRALKVLFSDKDRPGAPALWGRRPSDVGRP